MSRFAPITSVLLARKGEAKAWDEPQAADVQNVASIPWRPYAPAVAVPPPPGHDKDRSCSIRMSAQDFERLGILAVKKNSTRQQLLKEALAEFLDAKARDYGCACLRGAQCGSGASCQQDCGSEA